MATCRTSPPRRWTAGRIVLLVLGAVVTLTALGVLTGGGALLWAQESKRDDQGYFTTAPHRFETASSALATNSLDVRRGSSDWLFKSGRLARIRIRATSAKPIFLGIGRASDVRRYLAGTSYTRVRSVDYRPFRLTYEDVPAVARPRNPRPRASGTRVQVARARARSGGVWRRASGRSC